MRLEVTEEYFDIVLNEMKQPGAILDVSDERGRVLLDARVAKITKVQEAPAPKPAKRAKR